MQKQLKSILIVGGGSAGWMTAALFAHLCQGMYRIQLIESDDIGIIGVGEATIPAVKKFNELLKLDEAEFMRITQGTFKLGIQFKDWSHLGSSYIHGFGVIGKDWEWLRCHQYWLKLNQSGEAGDFANYSINTAAALQDKFVRAQTNMPESPLAHIAHAFHFDAGLYAKFLRRYAEARGVQRTEGKIVDVKLRGEDGAIEHVVLEDGTTATADLFIDCSGFRALLIESALKTGYEDWSNWLPCDRALAVPCARSEDFTPYTRSTARTAGWQWRIPLQHRTGNGHVFSSAHISDEDAVAALMSNLEGPALAEPRRLSFKTGRRHKLWSRNVVAIGLSGGFLEPLESTSIYLIQLGITTLLDLFPDRVGMAADAEEYNRIMALEFDRIRDFLVLHYVANQRDEPFWREMRTMAWPDSLSAKVEAFKSRGLLPDYDIGVFLPPSWLAVLVGQNIVPNGWDPRVDRLEPQVLSAKLAALRDAVRSTVGRTPDHMTFIRQAAQRAESVR